MAHNRPVVVLFGYDASPFTQKIRLCLKLKQIPYTFVRVSSMMPRPQLRESFNLSYRKIPVLAIGREIYCDTSVITEALELFFPSTEGFATLYPRLSDGRNYRPVIRGFASYWTDRPLFRVACGLMPGSIWKSDFGKDRESLIGHKIDGDKLEKKIPENLAALDQQISMLEPLFTGRDGESDNDGRPWIFSTSTPSLADIVLFYQLKWAGEVASGALTPAMTDGKIAEDGGGKLDGADPVFNVQRYPGLFAWFRTVQTYFEHLTSTETVAKDDDLDSILERMKRAPELGSRSLLTPTPRATLKDLDAKLGLSEGAVVSVAPDDTGRDQ